uniref:Mucin-related protein n=1 Tax=Davidia involucrata TaxID=16924 RepID=A0A5B7CDZ2_DAVIN
MMNPIQRLSSVIRRPLFNSSTHLRPLSTKSTTDRTTKNGDDEWNAAWESAWLPEDLSAKNRAPWETDVNFSLSDNNPTLVLPSDVDAETKAFVEDMTDNWDQRRNSAKAQQQQQQEMMKKDGNSLYSVENMKKDYRLKKQRIHAGLWMKEIDKQEEAKLGDSIGGGGDDIERLLDSCSEIFDPANNDLNNSKIPSSSEFRNKPDGWETTSKTKDGNIWEMSQREEDILLQEFERRIAFSKFQIASFIKTHIFSRRRPIDGWKYMIEELGPNARKGKGSVSRLPSLSDASTQPFKEERTPIASSLTSYKGR